MKNFKWFIKTYVRNYWGKISVIFVLGIFVGSVPVASVQFIKVILDDIFAKKDMTTLFLVPWALVGLYLLSGLSKYIHFYMQRSITEKMIMHLRNDLYSHLIKLPFSFYSKQTSGTMFTRVINDVQHIPKGVMLSIDFVREPITFFGLLATALYRNWQLTTLLLLAAPLVIFLFTKVGSTVKRYTSRNLEQFGVLGNLLNESFNGLKIVKAFSIEPFMRARFTSANNIFLRYIVKTYKVEELSTPLVEFVGSIVTAFVIFIGGMWVIQGSLTQGDFMTILVALGLAQQPVKKLNTSNLKIQTAIAALARVRSVLNIPIEKTRIGKNLETFNSTIEFKDISFRYTNEDGYVLKNINLKVKKGEIVALVGASGCGKTTLVNLIPRFYDVEEGALLIDGVNIKEYSLKSLREKISLVNQDTFLFNDTILMNIKSGKIHSSDDDVYNAAKAANAYNFVNQFPDKFHTIVGEKGLRLSGGEKQRITIARAIVKNTPILILDEATSALDSESEIQVQIGLNSLMKNKTTIVIAHRLSTIKNADRIIVLDQGEIVQEGTHNELINICGPYKIFYEKQGGK